MHHRIRGYLGSYEARTPFFCPILKMHGTFRDNQLIQISRHLCIVSTKLFGDRAITLLEVA